MQSKTDGMKAEATIEFRNDTYRINGSVDHSIVNEVSLCITAGELVVVLGRSGSGKTTLLKLINRMLTPSSGEVVVRGCATGEWDPIRLRRGIGYVIQDAG